MLFNLIHAVMALALTAAGWLILAPLRARDRWTWRIVASGFIIRAVVATALFLASLADVPGFRGLHNDAGIWFFAPDGRKYLSLANAIADGTAGLPAVLGQTQSPSFILVLVTAVFLTGPTVLSAVILNLLAYACTVRMLVFAVRDVRWLRTAVAIFAGTPTLVLWSLQPLKEALAYAAIAALVLLLGYVGRAVTGGLPWNRRNVTQSIGAAVGAALVIWFLAGIRWYVPAVLVAAAVTVALLMMMLRSRRGLIAGVVVLVGIVVAVELVGARKTSGGLPGRPGEGTFGAAWYVGAVLDVNRQTLNAPEARTRLRLGHAWQNAGAEPNGPAEVFPVAAGAWFLPPWLGSRVGLLTAEGTAATAALAFIEALIFDAAVILAVLGAVLAARAGGHDPVLWIALTAAVALTIALTYAIPNLGTILRHRGMVLVLCLLVISRAGFKRSSPPPAGDDGS